MNIEIKSIKKRVYELRKYDKLKRYGRILEIEPGEGRMRGQTIIRTEKDNQILLQNDDIMELDF